MNARSVFNHRCIICGKEAHITSVESKQFASKNSSSPLHLENSDGKWVLMCDECKTTLQEVMLILGEQKQEYQGENSVNKENPDDCSLKLRQSVLAVASLSEEQSDIPQSVFVTEECSELIKELTKARRGKGSEKDITAEACDVLTSVFILLCQMHVPEDHIRDLIIYKCERALNRFKATGTF